MPTLKAFVESYIQFTEAEWHVLENRLECTHYKKGEMIHSARDIWDELYYIKEGLIRSYLISDTGKETTRQLHFNNNKANILNLFVVDYASLSHQTPSTIGFEILQDCALVKINRETIDAIHAESKKWERLSRLFLESAYVKSTEFYQQVINRSAKENYQDLCENMSHLIELVPQYHLATYIGITPVSLSRIKQELES